MPRYPRPSAIPGRPGPDGTDGSIASGEPTSLKAVEPSRRRRPDANLDWLRIGDPDLGIAPAPVLAKELDPAFRYRIRERAPRTCDGVNEALKSFMRFSRSEGLQREQPIVSVVEITNADGFDYKKWLVTQKISARLGRTNLRIVSEVVSDARKRLGIRHWSLVWPTFKGRDDSPHADVSPAKVAEVGQVLERQHRLSGMALDEGALLGRDGVDPHSVGNGLEPEAWSSVANLARMYCALADDLLANPSKSISSWVPACAIPRDGWPQLSDRAALHRRMGAAPPRPPTCSVMAEPTMNSLRWCVPLHRDVACSLLHLMRLTGWNTETGLNVVFTGDWQRDAGVDPEGRRLVEIRGLKMRTGKFQYATGPAEGPDSAAQVVRDMIQRTAKLRGAAARRLKELRRETGFDNLVEAATLTDALESLWLYFVVGPRERTHSRIGRVLGDKYLRDTLHEAELATQGSRRPPYQGRTSAPSGKDLGRRRDWLLPGDFRDDLAGSIYSSSDESVVAVVEALGQDDPATAKSYLRQPRQIRKAKEAVAGFLDIVLDEVADRSLIDPAILLLRSQCRSVSERGRSLLTSSLPQPHNTADTSRSGHEPTKRERTLKASDAAIFHPEEFWVGWSGSRDPLSPSPAAFARMPADPTRLWVLPWDEIAACEVLPGCRIVDDVWQIPVGAHDLPTLTGQAASVDFRWLLPRGWARAEARSEAALRRMKRMAALLLTCPVAREGGVAAPPSEPTWQQMMHPLVLAGRLALAMRQKAGEGNGVSDGSPGNVVASGLCPDGPPVFGMLSHDDISEIASKVPLLSKVASRFQSLVNGGVFDDWASVDFAAAPETVPYPPFNDAFLTALLRGALSLVRIGGDILDCFREVLALEREGLAKEAKALLGQWRGSVLGPGADLGLRLRLVPNASRSCHKTVLASWPPRGVEDLHRLVKRLEEANYVVVSFSTLGRLAEVTTLPLGDPPTPDGSHTLQGAARKGSDAKEGSARYWPLRERAAAAVSCQQTLTSIVAPGSANLFDSWRRGGSKHCDFANVKTFAETLADCICQEGGRPISDLCDGAIHHARFRVSGVRLAALAMLGGELSMQWFLAHGSRASTVDYVQANPRVKSEYLSVIRRIAAMKAEEASDADLLERRGSDGRG